jgi:hypothetical protein
MTINPALKARIIELADKAAVTAAEGAILAVGAESVAVNALAVDWSTVGGFALGGAALSLLINIARGGITGRATKN